MTKARGALQTLYNIFHGLAFLDMRLGKQLIHKLKLTIMQRLADNPSLMDHTLVRSCRASRD